MNRFFLVLRLSCLLLLGSLYLHGCAPTERTMLRSSTELSLKWVYRASERIKAPPLYSTHRVILRTTSQVVGIDSGSGSLIWSVPAGSTSTGLLVASAETQTVAVAADNDYLLKLVHTEDGFTRWSQTGSVLSIAMDNERVYVGRDRNSIPAQAYKLSDGTSLWVSDQQVRRGAPTHYVFAEAEGLAVFTQDNLYVLDKETGKLQRTLTDFLQGASNLQLIGNQVFMWGNRKLRVKDALDGRLLWEADVTPFYYAVIGNRVIVGTRCCTLTALDVSTGAMLWQRELEGEIISNPLALGTEGYIILDNASIVAFDLETGADKGRIETNPAQVNPEGASKGLATDGINLFATFGDNTLFAFGR